VTAGTRSTSGRPGGEQGPVVLEDGRSRTLEEVGNEFKITRERIRQIEAKALRKLRHSSRARKLRDFLEEPGSRAVAAWLRRVRAPGPQSGSVVDAVAAKPGTSLDTTEIAACLAYTVGKSEE
jgi:hypothetical protein